MTFLVCCCSGTKVRSRGCVWVKNNLCNWNTHSDCQLLCEECRVWTVKRFIMHGHVNKEAKVKPEEQKSSNMKWWISAGVIAFILVCAFIGITLWLGLNVETEDNIKGNNNVNFNQKETSSSARTEKQVVLGTADQKNTEGSQGEESDGKHMKKKQGDKLAVTETTELFGSRDKDVGEDAHVEEVNKSHTTGKETNFPTDTTVIHLKESLTSGSPLYPQPIPETPAFVPEEPTVREAITSETIPTGIANSRRNASEQESTPDSSTGMEIEKESDTKQNIFGKPEHNTDELLNVFLHNPIQENRPVSFEEGIDNTFLGQENKDIRQFYISDAITEKGEHFMPQNFEYPHDRDFVVSEHFHNPHATESLVREHRLEITEDGVDRDDIPSLDHDDGLFYTPSNPDRYDGEDPDLAENPFTTFLQGRLQELYTWLSSDEDTTEKYKSGSNDNSSLSDDFMKVLVAVNRSLNEGNSSILLGQLKDLYYGESKLNVTDPAVLHNSSSLVSFGLLAFDLLLLRNVQQIAWEEEKVSSEEMMKDPEVLALNALFMPPDKVRQLQEPTSRIGKENKEDEKDKSLLQELMEFVNGSLRAVLNLGRAYRRSVGSGDLSRASSNALDCIWTLYCRNLDKTARLKGPYGFLAKMNSLGLRMVMGEFPVERALEHVLREATRGWNHMDCEKLFPRCTVTEATDVVLKTALGITGDT